MAPESSNGVSITGTMPSTEVVACLAVVMLLISGEGFDERALRPPSGGCSQGFSGDGPVVDRFAHQQEVAHGPRKRDARGRQQSRDERPGLGAVAGQDRCEGAARKAAEVLHRA